MTLTKTQIFHRTESLSGEIKAAREAQSECRKALADQERLTHIAAQAVERADARVAELEAERAELAEQARVAILGVGEPPPLADEDGPKPEMSVLDPSPQVDEAEQLLDYNAIFNEPADFQAEKIITERGESWCPQHQCYHTLEECEERLKSEEPDFQAQAMQNGLDRIGEIVDEARR